MKILGIIILITSGLMAGYFFGEKYTEKIAFWDQYINLITLIKNQILCSATHLKSILENSNVNYPIKNYVDLCLKLSENRTFSEAWHEAFETYQINFELSKEEQNFIASFGENLGTSDCKTQSCACTEHSEIAKLYLKKAINEKNTKGKLPIMLGASAGAAVAILLI